MKPVSLKKILLILIPALVVAALGITLAVTQP